MTLENKILRDLSAGQTTLESMSHRLDQKPKTLQSILETLTISGQVETYQLGFHPNLTVYRLNPSTQSIKSTKSPT